MCSTDEFLTIKSQTQTEIKVKGSRFIGTATPIQSVEDAENFINRIAKQFYNATHNCYAFRIRVADQIISKYHDAGEPSGTAGLPILTVINGRNLFNIVVVVTRYFGGTKLGKGGLMRAYSDCTQEVLDRCMTVKKYDLASLTFCFPYRFTGNVMHVVSQLKGKVLSSTYSHQTQLKIEILHSLADNCKNKLIEATSGKINFT